MFDQEVYRCPQCRTEIRQRLSDGDDLRCGSCGRRYSVMLDNNTGRAGLIDVSRKEVPEPLYLPKGSIRALSTLLMAGCCWYRIFTDKPVPTYLFSLLLTIIGYYFGFRHKVKAAGSKIFDATAKKEEPLFLPPGLIRFVLTTGFVISIVVLAQRGTLLELEYFEFFMILAGLIVGYFFGRIISPMQDSSLHQMIGHVKGGVMLAAAVVLGWHLIGGTLPVPGGEYVPLTLAAVISFYFGSRS